MTPALRRLLPTCLFFSGAAALVLEVAWSRALSLSLGNSHQAVATVVASMMTGLCLGSLTAARCLPRVKRPARSYGLVELGVGSYSALTPLLFKALPGILAPLYAFPQPVFASLRFLIVFSLLLPASSGMGATLPLLTAALTRGKTDLPDGGGPGSVGGCLYGLNTLGAFLGTLAGGFLFLPRLGLLKTTLLGAGTSLGVGTLVWLVADEAIRQKTRMPEPARRPAAGAAWILPLYAASGCLAMVYEITWTRVLAPLAGTSVYSFTLILAAILAGIGIGSLVLSLVPPGSFHPGRGFVLGQLILALSAFLSTWGLRGFPDLLIEVAARTRSRPGMFFLWEFILFLTIVLFPGMVLGALFPLAARLVPESEAQAAVGVGRVYAWNTAGSIAGALAAGFFLVETLGSERTLVLASAGSALVGAASLPLAPGRRFRPAAAVLGCGLAFTFPFLVPSWDLYRMTSGITQVLRHLRNQGPGYSAEVTRGAARTAGAQVAFHKEGKTSTVTVVREWLDVWLRVDGKTDASTTAEDMLTQVLLGQVPFFFVPRPNYACVIGFGSGVTSHAVLTHPVRRVDTIEIERQVIEASRLFESVNFRPLSDPRSRLIVEDARTALLYRPQTYDIIISEPSNPWMAGVNNLFTGEFYRLVRKRLNRGGVFCQWVQSYEMSAESLQMILNTLAASFPHTHLFFSNLASDMILLASEEPLSLVAEAAGLFPDRPEVAGDLARVGVHNLADLAILYTTPVAAPQAGTLLNDDDNSLIQYRAPLEMFRGDEPSDLGIRTSVPDLEALFYPGRNERDVLPELGQAARRREAVGTVQAIAWLLGQKGYPAEGKEVQALADELRRQLEQRARINELLGEAEGRVGALDAPGAIASLEQAEALDLDGPEQNSRSGYVWLKVGRYDQAERRFDQTVAPGESRFLYQALAGRGAARFRLGRREEGLADIASARKLDPDQPLTYLLLGTALFDAGAKEAALRELRTGLKRTPTDERLKSTLQMVLSSPSGSPVPAAAGPSPRGD